MSAEYPEPRRKIDYNLIRGEDEDRISWATAIRDALDEIVEEGILKSLPISEQVYLDLRRRWIAEQEGRRRIPLEVEKALRRRAKELTGELETEEGL